MEAAFMEDTNKEENAVACSKRRRQSFRSSRRNEKSRMHSIDWTVFSSMHTDLMTFDVIAPSMWTIIGCKNGLRLFKEAKDVDFPNKNWEDHPAIMTVGVVDAASESIFQTVMSLGQSRSEWDFCLLEGNVIENLDDYTDIIHKKLRGDWLPWGMKRRDLLLRRYWRKEDNGTYIILYHSVVHHKCQPEKGYVRAWLKSGGYEISPVNQGKQSIVKHMLAIDWKFWKLYIFTSSSMGITTKMLERVAALREFFRAKLGHSAFSDFSSDGLTREIVLPQTEEQIKLDMQSVDENNKIESFAKEIQMSSPKHAGNGSLRQLNDAADEFFDVLTEAEYDQTEFWPADENMQTQLVQDQCQGELSTTAVFIEKLHDVSVQKSGSADFEESHTGDSMSCNYGTTLPKDPNCSVVCSWATADPSTFLIRGESYLHDHQKVKASETLMQMVAADWLKSDKREDDLGGRPDGIVQKYAAQGGSKFFFIVNMQVPGSTTYSLALYYMMDMPLEDVPLLESFVKGNDAYRNSRFKLIPYISKGSWLVKQSVGQKACLVGQALDINYFRGSNYLEVAIDVGSSTVARSVVSLVIGYLNSLVIEMAFLMQGDKQEELPEFLLGTCRLNQLDIAKAVPINPS
ncbi:protein ENHANCED DISEASE RESISTANCE 2-like [Musa acuminata AAA Group]|uniref:protein ENHANCED DISEASE RESISTANCE 2-like n=1 Tax=Musa acuminata AAA Group TaxID=214697 RepID=UPI0031D34C67